MFVSDPLGDMLTRIRNALSRKKPVVMTPASTLRLHVLDVLSSIFATNSYSASSPCWSNI